MSKTAKAKNLIQELTLSGIELAPAQVLGGIRLVPLRRPDHRQDLRLSQRVYDHNGHSSFVNLPKDRQYSAYIPHGLVASWEPNGGAVYGTSAVKHTEGKNTSPARAASQHSVTRIHRMVQRESAKRLRFLPQHIAMEGFLCLYFGGPDIAWSEYTRSALAYGLGRRVEQVVSGEEMPGMSDALRLFEIHGNQIGMLLYVADTLAAVFVVPHPDDYRALHRTLVCDFYGELMFQYGLYATEANISVPSVNHHKVNSFNDLRQELSRMRSDWSEWHQQPLEQLFNVPLQSTRVYDFHPFSLQRFTTGLNPEEENHIGEVIVDETKTIQYLKTYRLSATQRRRAYLLSQLSLHQWHLDNCAKALGCNRNELVLRLHNAGFSYLLHEHILDAAKAWQRKR